MKLMTWKTIIYKSTAESFIGDKKVTLFFRDKKASNLDPEIQNLSNLIIGPSYYYVSGIVDTYP